MMSGPAAPSSTGGGGVHIAVIPGGYSGAAPAEAQQLAFGALLKSVVLAELVIPSAGEQAVEVIGFGSAGLGSPAPQAEPQAETAFSSRFRFQPNKFFSPIVYFLLMLFENQPS